jgi:L-asparagine oxygenase
VDIFKALKLNGFADFGVFHPDESSAQVVARIAIEIECIHSRQTESLTANPIDAKPINTYAGNFGLGQLPLHTDLAHWHVPPRYLMLRCIVADPSISTMVVHHKRALAKVPDAIIDRALFRPRRRLEGKMFLLRLRDMEIFRWDQLFLKPDNAEARQACDALVNQLDRNEVHAITLDAPGRTVLIDNWAALHGRSAASSLGTDRVIERAYFSNRKRDEQNAQ